MQNNFYDNMKQVYESRLAKYGATPKTLGWFKGKQLMRFHALLHHLELSNRSILDVGCGFGDLNKYLLALDIDYRYTGVDIVPGFIDIAKSHYVNFDNIKFHCGTFEDMDFNKFDFVVSSGIFNFNDGTLNDYSRITLVLDKMFSVAKHAVSCDFLSDQVDFKKYDITFHSSPGEILKIFYKHTRRVSLNNMYAPFEFAVTGFCDDKFDPESTIFNKYLASGDPI